MPLQHALSRTELLIGKDPLEKLRTKKVAVLGIGGVGSYTVEALARCSVGHLLLVDQDSVCATNLNRQIHATRKTIGRNKVDVMRERVNEIDAEIHVDARCLRLTPDNVPQVLNASIDYVVDAIDTVTTKIAVAVHCFNNNIKLISCMGTGNKLDPTRFVVADLYKTRTCPLAKVMRKELRKRGVTQLKVVYSEEIPLQPLEADSPIPQSADAHRDDGGAQDRGRRQAPASISFVPPVAGFILASEVIKDLAELQ